MATKYEAIINYGLQNKKSKQDIIAALVKENELNSAGAYLDQLDKIGAFGGDSPVNQEKDKKNTELYDSIDIVNQLSSKIDSNKGFEGAVGSSLQKFLPGWAKPGEGQFIAGTDPANFEALHNQIIGKLKLEAREKLKGSGQISDAEQKMLGESVAALNIDSSEEEYKTQLGKIKDILNKAYQRTGGTEGAKGTTDTPEQIADKLNNAYKFAEANPDDPQSKRFMDDWNNNRIDLITGKLKDEFRELTPYEKKLKEQTGSVDSATTQLTQSEDKKVDMDRDLIGRTWDATIKAIPELAGDLGNRVKNIFTNSLDLGTKAKDRSVFENVLVGSENWLRNAGEVGGAIGDIASRAMELAYNAAVPNDKKELIKKTASDFMQTDNGQQAMQALQGGVEMWEDFKKNNPNAAKDLAAAFNIVTALPLGKGMGMAAKEAKNITGDVVEAGVRTFGKDAADAVSDDIFRAVKPSITVDRDKKAIRTVLNSANDELVSRGFKPSNLKEYADNLLETRKQVWSEIESKIGSGDGLKIDLKPITDELMSMANDSNLLRVDKTVAERIKNMATSLMSEGDKISIPDAEALKQFINAELKGAFGKFNLSNAEQNARKIITKRIGEQLDDYLSNIPGEFQSLKNKYGALRQTEDDVLKRLVVFERQNPQSLVESFSKISGVGNILKGFVPGGGGISSIANGVGELALGQIQKRANDANLLVKNAFEKLSKRTGEFKPKSKTFNLIKRN